jgi:hypothetical protein
MAQAWYAFVDKFNTGTEAEVSSRDQRSGLPYPYEMLHSTDIALPEFIIRCKFAVRCLIESGAKC